MTEERARQVVEMIAQLARLEADRASQAARTKLKQELVGLLKGA